MKQIGLFCFSFIVRHFFFLHTFFSKDLWCYKESARWTLLYREYFFSSTLHCLFLTQMDTNIGLGWVGIAWMWCVNARACVAFFLSSQLSHFLSFLVTKGSPPFFFFPTAVLRNDKRRDKCWVRKAKTVPHCGFILLDHVLASVCSVKMFFFWWEPLTINLELQVWLL